MMTMTTLVHRKPPSNGAAVGASVIVDDPLPLVARALTAELGTGVVVSTVALDTAWRPSADVAVVVVSLVDERAWRALRRLADASSTAVVALLDEPTTTMTRDALRAGATSVCDRGATAREIAGVIECTLAGGAVIPARVAEREVDERAWSDEERSWLRDLAAGDSVGALAWRYGFSRRTMARRLHDVYRRLGTTRQAPALAEAARRGLLRA